MHIVTQYVEFLACANGLSKFQIDWISNKIDGSNIYMNYKCVDWEFANFSNEAVVMVNMSINGDDTVNVTDNFRKMVSISSISIANKQVSY